MVGWLGEHSKMPYETPEIIKKDIKALRDAKEKGEPRRGRDVRNKEKEREREKEKKRKRERFF